MEKPGIKRLVEAFDDCSRTMVECKDMDAQGIDLKDICMKALFELNRTTLILNAFILNEEIEHGG